MVHMAWLPFREAGAHYSRFIYPQVYYFNTLTEESAWDKPADFVGGDAAETGEPTPVSSFLVPGTDWTEVLCDDGRKYYYNSATEVRPRQQRRPAAVERADI